MQESTCGTVATCRPVTSLQTRSFTEFLLSYLSSLMWYWPNKQLRVDANFLQK